MDLHAPESDDELAARAARRQEVMEELISASAEMDIDAYAVYAVEVLKSLSHQDLLVITARLIMERGGLGA